MIYLNTTIAATLLLLLPGLSFAGSSVSVSCSGNGSAVVSAGGSYASIDCADQSAPRGVTVTETFSFGPFAKLSVSGTYNLLVKLGAENTVTITGDSNHLENNPPTMRDGQLQIIGPNRSESSYDIDVVATTLRAVQLSGAGKSEITGDFPSGFSLRVSGAGNTELDVATTGEILIQRRGAGTVSATGSAASVEVEASGAGAVNLESLKVETASIDLSGAVTLSMCASQSANGVLTGAATVQVYCQPKERAISASAGATVNYH